MYGTVAHLWAKPGTESKFQELVKEYEQLKIPGHVATYVYRLDSNPNEYLLSTVFESKESYTANASSPEQDGRYRKMLDLLIREPEWQDGEIVYSGVYSKSRAF
jgi:heme-degrading monooxygenase HmoA